MVLFALGIATTTEDLTPWEKVGKWLQSIIDGEKSDSRMPILPLIDQVVQECQKLVGILPWMFQSTPATQRLDPRVIVGPADQNMNRALAILYLETLSRQIEDADLATLSITLILKRLDPALRHLRQALEKAQDDREQFVSRHSL